MRGGARVLTARPSELSGGDVRTAFVFAGQGSHYPRMAAAALAADAGFLSHMQRLDRSVRAMHGWSLLQAVAAGCGGKAGERGALVESHVAIFCVQYALACAAQERGIRPDVVLGQSLGEIVAMVVAGIVREEDALILLASQASIIERAVGRGHLVSVLGDAPDVMALAQRYPGIELAGIHWPGHVMFAVGGGEIAAFEAEMASRDVLCYRISVEYPFHSSRLEPARAALLASIATFPFHRARIPFFSPTTAAMETTSDPMHVWRIIRERLDFPRAMSALVATERLSFYDFSPNASMQALLVKNARGMQVRAVLDPFRDGRMLI